MMWVVCCHVDKPLEGEEPRSIYDVSIQAGAALTEIRVAPFNDYDDDPDSISDRNERYSECTAMEWISRHLVTDYVGVSHYRRRFALSDSELSRLLDDGFDMVTALWDPLDCSIREKSSDSEADWKLFMDILEEFHPEDLPIARKHYAGNVLHGANLHIFRREIYEEYAAWAFPMIDAFYHRSCRKRDRYSRRDAGFVGERLTSLFVAKLEERGGKVIYAEPNILPSHNWKPKDECALDEPEEVLAALRRLYQADKIIECADLLGAYLRNGDSANPLFVQIYLALRIWLEERKVLPRTMLEYLPDYLACDLDTLANTCQSLQKIIASIIEEETPEKYALLEEFVSLTGFSDIALNTVETMIRRSLE